MLLAPSGRLNFKYWNIHCAMSRCCMAPDTFAAPLAIKSSTGVTLLLTLSILPTSTMQVDKTRPHKISVWQVIVVRVFFRKLDVLALFLSQTSLSDCVGGGKCEESREWAGLYPEAADPNSRWERPAQSTLFLFSSLTHTHSHARTS